MKQSAERNIGGEREKERERQTDRQTKKKDSDRGRAERQIN